MPRTSRSRTPWLAAAALAIGCGPPVELTSAEEVAEIARMYAEYESDFPEVEAIDAAELRNRLESGAGSPPLVVVDVRPEKERSVSMIPGAISLEEFESDPERFGGAELVTYCTVGYRSGVVADRLQAEGYDVRNLRGSLLAWTHAGGELVDSEGPTDRLHVYGKTWDLAPDEIETTW